MMTSLEMKTVHEIILSWSLHLKCLLMNTVAVKINVSLDMKVAYVGSYK